MERINQRIKFPNFIKKQYVIASSENTYFQFKISNRSWQKKRHLIFNLLLVLLSFLYIKPIQAQCPDIEIIDLRNVSGYAQLDDMNACGAADTLSLIIYTGDPGLIKGFELELNLPTGFDYAGWEYAEYSGTSISNADPSLTNPEFIVDGFGADSIIIVNIGLEVNCNADVTELLFIDFRYSYTFIDTANVVHTCNGLFTPDREYNSAVKIPVLNVLSPLIDPEVTITDVGSVFCQQINISQDGLSAALDSFTFEISGLDFSGDLVLESITANGTYPVSSTYDASTNTTSALIEGYMFVGNGLASPDDNQFNTNEIITMEVCYRLTSCPSLADIPFDYNASYGCKEEICETSSQTSFIRVRPTGSLMPTAEVGLDAAPFVCGNDGEVVLKVRNPNTNTAQNLYTDLTIGFETCEVANMEISQVEIGGMILPDSTYGWVGDDLFVDFTKVSIDPDGAGGMQDFDGDGFFDDLVGGDSVELKVYLGVTCGNGLPDPANDVCPANDCNFSQFYVEAKTNCGNTFKSYPPGITGFDIVYAPTSVTNPTEYDIPVGNPITVGYDFQQFGDIGTSSSPDTVSSSQTVIFCYDFATQNFNGCTDSDVYLQVRFSGTEGYIYDMEITSAELSTDGGSTYPVVADLTTDVSWTAVSDQVRTLKIDMGSTASNICYRYTLEMDSIWCPVPSVWFGTQQVIEKCTDLACGPEGCELVRACKTATFHGDAETWDCVCYLSGGVREIYRKNYGFTDASQTTQVNREDVSLEDQVRFLPCDTMVVDYWHVITSDYPLSLAIERLHLSLRVGGSSSTSATMTDALLAINHSSKTLLELSVNKKGTSYATRNILDLSTLPGCANGALEHDFATMPWGDGTSFGTYYKGNSTNDVLDGGVMRLSIQNDCDSNGDGNCVDEFLAAANLEAGDTINVRMEFEMMKNLYREGLIKKELPYGTNSNQKLYNGSYIYINDGTKCNINIGNDCGFDPPFFSAHPGEVTSLSQVDLNSCGGTIEHTFYMNPTIPLGWFSDEFRPIINIFDIDDPMHTPMSYCGNGEVVNYVDGVPVPISITPTSTDNLFCIPVSGYPEDVCAVDAGTTGTIFWNPYEAGAKALGIGNIPQDSLTLKYDFCLLCPEALSVTDYKIIYDYGYLCDVSENSAAYRCNGESLCVDGLGQPAENSSTIYYAEELFGPELDSCIVKIYDACGPNVIINDTRTPVQNVIASLGDGANSLIASSSPGVSEEIQAISICNPDPSEMANGVAASITIPSSVRLVNVYDDAGQSIILDTTFLSDNGTEQRYMVTLSSSSLAVNECDTIYVGTTLLYCPDPSDLPPTICVGVTSGCADIALRAALSATSGCGNNEICYSYISGEVGLQTEWFDFVSPIDLCDTVIFNVRVKNVKELLLLDLVPTFTLPPGLTIVNDSWEVAYPGGPTTIGSWTSIDNPDIIAGNTYTYSDASLWNSTVDMNGLEGVSSANATEDENKVAFRFKAYTLCDQFLSGSKLQTETSAADPCSDGPISSGSKDSPPVIVAGADPAQNAQLLIIADPEELNCRATVNTFGITALNISDYATADSVQTCITLPADLAYVPNSIKVSQPTGYSITDEIITTIGTTTQVCFVSPKIGQSQSMKITFDAEVVETASCGDVPILVDIKSVVEGITCQPGPDACDVFVQNSLNSRVFVEIKPPFIADDLVVYTDCSSSPSIMDLYYEWIINHNGPDAVNQDYTVNFYEDIDGDQLVNANIDNIIGTDNGTFSVNDGDAIIISGNVLVDAARSCPVLFEVVYPTSCTCNREEQYFNKITTKALRNYTEPIALCSGDCLDIDVCDFVSVTADSIQSATGVAYIPSLDWPQQNLYTLPHDTLADGSIIKGPTSAFLSYEELTNNSTGTMSGEEGMLFVEQGTHSASGILYEDAWLELTYAAPVNVTKIYMGGGRVAGWNPIRSLHTTYGNTPMTLQYSLNGVNWILAHTFNSPTTFTVDETVLPTPIAAQYWRISSTSDNDNWGTTELRLEGEGVPYESNSPVTKTGTIVTICVPSDAGIEAPWPVTFTTGTGDCQVEETIEIWNIDSLDVDAGIDQIYCEGNPCIDLEGVLPQGVDASTVIVQWSPTLGVANPNALETKLCPTADQTYTLSVTFPGGCVKTDMVTIDYISTEAPQPSIPVVVCAVPGPIVASAGFPYYEWYETIGGFDILVATGTSNEYIAPTDGTYIVKMYDGVSECHVREEVYEYSIVDCDQSDYSDTCTDGPCHYVSSDIYLGSAITADTSNLNTIAASGDEDDGVQILSSLDVVPGGDFRLPVHMYNVTGNTAYLYVWVDWNGDGDFMDTDEVITTTPNSYNNTGSFTDILNINVPSTVNSPIIGVRFRFSTDTSMNASDACGTGLCAADGEIEDYIILVNCEEKCLPTSFKIKRGARK